MDSDRVLLIATLVLAAMAAAYTAKAIALLAFSPIGANDLHQRWLDQHYIRRHQNPYDVFLHAAQPTRPVPSGRDAQADPLVGPPLSGGYPIWSFFTGYALFSFPWRAERIFWALLTLASMAVLGQWAWDLARARRAEPFIAAFAAAAVLAVATLGTSTSLGQFSAPLLAAIVLAERVISWAERPGAPGYRRALAAGICGVLLGAAMSKPQVAAPFLVVHLVRRRWGVLLATAVYIAVASLVVWAVTRTGPIEMSRQMIEASAAYLGDAYGPPQLLASAGMPLKGAMLLTALVVPAITAGLMFARSAAPLTALYAVAAVGGRLWTYHKLYDNPMVMFLLIALVVRATTEPRPALARVFWGMLVAVGLTLWLPPKLCDHPWFQVSQLLIWSAAGLGVLIAPGGRRSTGVGNLQAG